MRWQPAPQRLRRRRQERARARGQALVEFALIAPLFLMLIFGIVEFALINASVGAFNFAAKEGARYDAIIGNGAPPGTTPPPLDQYMVANSILPHISGVVMAQMTEVVVFQADQTGKCAGGGTPPNCANQDILQKVGGTWQTTSNTWTAARNDQLANADYVGVYIAYNYTYLTAFFAVTSPTLSLSAISVQRIEPQQYGDRGAPPPVANVSAGPAWPASPLFDASAQANLTFIEPWRYYGYLAGARV